MANNRMEKHKEWIWKTSRKPRVSHLFCRTRPVDLDFLPKPCNSHHRQTPCSSSFSKARFVINRMVTNSLRLTVPVSCILCTKYITWRNICLYQFHLRNYYKDFHQNSYSRTGARCSMPFLIVGIPLSTPTSNHEEVGHPDSRYSLFSSVLPSFAATIPQIGG
jgi:hypothetical protein